MRHVFFLFALIFSAMVAVPPTALAAAGAEGAPTICSSGVIVRPGEPCPSYTKWCADGTEVPKDIWKPERAIVDAYCEPHGGPGRDPNEVMPAPAPAPAAPTAQCKDGTTVPAATVAKGRSAITSYCASRGGLKGAVTTTR